MPSPMRIIGWFLAALLLTFVVAFAAAGPVVERAVRRALATSYDGRSHIESVRLTWPAGLEIRSLHLSKAGEDLSIGTLRIQWSISRLLHRRREEPALRTAIQSLSHLSIDDASYHSGELSLKDLRLSYDRPGGELTVGGLSSGKWKMSDLRGTILLTEDALFIRPLKGLFLQHPVEAELTLPLTKDPRAILSCRTRALPIQSLIRFMEWEKKIAVTGDADGTATLDLSLTGLRSLEGRFDAPNSGGNIEILDPEFLKRIADSAKQPYEIVEASLKNYRYNSGLASFRMSGHNLKLSLNLSGDAGKRDLEVELHDVFKN